MVVLKSFIGYYFLYLFFGPLLVETFQVLSWDSIHGILVGLVIGTSIGRFLYNS